MLSSCSISCDIEKIYKIKIPLFEVDEIALEILINNKIDWIVPLFYFVSDEMGCLHYDTSQLFCIKDISIALIHRDYCLQLERFCSEIQKCEGWLLCKKALLLSENNIYYDPERRIIQIFYIPQKGNQLTRETDRSGLQSLWDILVEKEADQGNPNFPKKTVTCFNQILYTLREERMKTQQQILARKSLSNHEDTNRAVESDCQLLDIRPISEATASSNPPESHRKQKIFRWPFAKGRKLNQPSLQVDAPMLVVESSSFYGSQPSEQEDGTIRERRYYLSLLINSSRYYFPEKLMMDLRKGGYCIGSKSLHIEDRLEYKGVLSKQHCNLEIKHGRLILKDLNSQYGTFLNGERLSSNCPREASVGDKLGLSSQVEYLICKET